VPVPLKFDPEPPQLAFEQGSSSDPTLVSVAVTDRVSGLASGQIELSRQGTGTWQSLATERQGDRLLARIDDSLLPAGVYLLRATAWDQASNQNSTDKRANGEPMVVTLPLRAPTVLRAGVQTERTIRRSIRRRGKRRTVRRRVVELRPQAEVRYGERVTIVGRLENRDGQPVPGAEIQVLSSSATAPEQLLGVVTSDADGRFRYEALADATRTLKFVYRGTPVLLPTQGEVSLLTSAASTLRARPRRLRNGQSVRFSGRLRALPAPAAGKLVELQVVLSGRWQTFRTTRTQADGSWAIRYRFRRTCGLLRYRFRARLPAEAGYAFQTGYTRALAVRVRGGRCS
jgi:5-hydroxyisourate hydrolase-like protein (transthyretin family)